VRNYRLLVASIAFAAIMPAAAFAACPVGKRTGDVYCNNRYWWKCDICAGEPCEILQADRGRCYKDDPNEDVTDISRRVKRILASAREIPSYSPRR
jgi:hypothetical protein